MSFFHFSNDDLSKLNDVFTKDAFGSIAVHVTSQVRSEFIRNREARIFDALNRFENSISSPQIPSFMKGYEELEALKNAGELLKEKSAAILKLVNSDVEGEDLKADIVIKSIFSNSERLEVDDNIYDRAVRRVSLGEPPGKKGSLGDAVNWLLLLNAVLNGKNIYIVSGDGGFFSKLDGNRIQPFLHDE